MASAWAVSDHLLWRMLSDWVKDLNPSLVWYVDLYVNDYEPQPGDTFSNYVTPNWSQWFGYVNQQMPTANWGSVQVTQHVAQTINSSFVNWMFPISQSEPLIVYGYVVTDENSNYVDSESFDTPLTLTAGVNVTLVPVLNLGIFPVPSMLNKKRGRKRRVQEGTNESEE